MALHTRDNKCKEKGFKFFEIAAIVMEEGGAAHTIDLCWRCYGGRRLTRGEKEVTAAKWSALVQQKAFRGKLWAAFDMEQFVPRMWERFTIKKKWADRSWQMQKVSGKMERTAGVATHNTPHREELAMTCVFEDVLVRQAYYAGNSGDWTSSGVWASAKVRECHKEVEQEDEDRKSIAR